MLIGLSVRAFASRWWRVVLAWFISNSLWPYGSAAGSALVSIFAARATGLSSPWVYIFFVAATIFGASLALGLLRPAIHRYLGQPATQSQIASAVTQKQTDPLNWRSEVELLVHRHRIKLRLVSTRGTQWISDVACDVRTPANHPPVRAVMTVRGQPLFVECLYPEDFASAPYATSGDYTVVWSAADDESEWQEILRDTVRIEFPSYEGKSFVEQLDLAIQLGSDLLRRAERTMGASAMYQMRPEFAQWWNNAIAMVIENRPRLHDQLEGISPDGWSRGNNPTAAREEIRGYLIRLDEIRAEAKGEL